MDLTPGSVVSYYLGSEQDFTQPKSYQSMLEVSHYHVFSMGLLVLTLTHLMIMTNLSVLIKIWLSALVYFMPIRLSPKTSISCIILQVLSYVCAALWSIGRKRDFLSIILGSNRIGMVYLSAIADEVAGWLVRFVHPDFAYFKIASFVLLEISLVTLIILFTISLFYARRKM